MRLTPERFVLAGGMIEFQKETLARFREHVLDDARGSELTAIVADLRAGGYFVGGESYKRLPSGVPPDHPRASLLKHGALFANRETKHPPELGTAAFPELVLEHFVRMAPLHTWLVALGA